MDWSSRQPVTSVAQFYETTIHDRDSARAFSFVVVPARSVRDREVPPADLVAHQLGFRDAPEARPRRWPPVGRVAPWLLPFAIDLALGRDEEEFYRWGPFFLEEHLFGPRHRRAERAGPSAFAQYLAYAPVVPFESSPLAPKALSDLAAAGGGIGGALGAYVTGDPLLLLTIPAGIVVCGAARGVGQALEIGLRARVLDFMGVEDPDAPKDDPPSSEDSE
jgi:hypothetical protein